MLAGFPPGEVEDGGSRFAALVLALIASTALSSFWGANPAMAQSGSVTVTVTLTVTATATVDVDKAQAATRTAIRGLMSDRARFLTSTGPDTTRMHARLAGGTLFGGAESQTTDGASTGFARSTGRPSIMSNSVGGLGAGTPLGGNSLGALSPGSGGGATLFANPSDRGGIFDRYGRFPTDFPTGPDGPPLFNSQGEIEPVVQPAGRGSMPFRFSGSVEEGVGRFSFSASLSQMRAAAEQREREKVAAAGLGGLGLASGTSTHAKSRPAAVDVWIEGASGYVKSDRPEGKRSGHASIAMAGADYLVRPGLLVGLMGQFDWMSDSASGTLTTSREGRGWMAGPYVSARLTPNIYFDARATWGGARPTRSILSAPTRTTLTGRACSPRRSSPGSGHREHGDSARAQRLCISRRRRKPTATRSASTSQARRSR